MRKDESMGYKYYSVINIQNRYKTLVLVINEPDETGEIQERVQYYTLLEGERLIDAAPPVNGRRSTPRRLLPHPLKVNALRLWKRR